MLFLGACPKREDTVTETTERPSEAERVSAYRVARFEELGFSYPLALELTLAGTDWHEAKNLLARVLIKESDPRAHDLVAEILL